MQMRSKKEVQKRIRTARVAVSMIFFVNGALLASWVPHIPYVRNKLQLSEGMLGLALLSVAVGALISLILSGWLIERFGSRRVTSFATIAFALSLPLPVMAPDLALLILALALFGASNGAMDVAMNAQGIIIEKEYASPIMSSLHGLFSVGGLVGAGMGGIALYVGFTPSGHVLSAAGLLGVVGVISLLGLLPEDGSTEIRKPRLALPTGPVLGLSILAFFTAVGEGSMADWSAEYLRNTLGTGPGLAAAGFTAFSLMMAAGRLTGDRLVAWIGPVGLVRLSALVAAVGLGLGLIIPHFAAAIAGFGCVGLGLANVIPVLYSAAGRTPGVSPGRGIASVATVGYLGFLSGPPLIGFAAELITLRWALGLVALFTTSIALFAWVIRRGKA